MECLLRVCVLVLCVWRVYAQTPTATISPLGFNASLGSSSTVFQCDVTGAENIEWRVDGTPSNIVTVTSRGILTSDVIPVDSATGTLTSTLTVPTTEENDNTEIFCIARHLMNGDISPTVLHLVQGFLDPPASPEITDVQGSAFMRRMGWDAPDTIDLTDIDPDISYYEVCFNVSDDELTCEVVLETSHGYPFVNVRVPLLFSVSAVNIVGKSNTSTVEHQACDPTADPISVSGSDVNTQVRFQGGSDTSIQISFPQTTSTGEDEDCFNLYSVELSPLSGTGTTTTHGPFIPDVTGPENRRVLSVSVDSNLTENEVYTVTLLTVNVNGGVNSTGDISFSSYDVQGVSVSPIAGGLSLSCTFTEGSEARGCRLTVCERIGGNINQNSCEDVIITRSTQTSTTTLLGLQLGVYAVTEVVDLENDSSESVLNSGAIVIADVEVTELEPTTTQQPTIPTVQTPQPLTPGPTDDNKTAIIIGCVVAGLVVLILVVAIIAVCCVLLKTRRRRDKQAQHSQAYGVTPRPQLWHDESDGGIKLIPPAVTQTNGETTNTDALNPMYEDPITTIAVIQGGGVSSGGHHNLIRTATDPATQSHSEPVTISSHEPPGHNSTDYEVRSATSPLYTDIMESSQKIDLANISDDDTPPKIPVKQLTNEDLEKLNLHIAPAVPVQNLSAEDIKELHLTSSERSLTSESGKPKLSFEDLKASNESLLSIGSQGSMTGAHPTYAQLEHHRGSKKKKEPHDKTGVLYSEIKVDEIPPVLPQKKLRRETSSSTGVGYGLDGHLV